MTDSRHHAHRRAAGGRAAPRTRGDLQDALSAIAERTDLERLFDRKVGFSQILRLAGRGVEPDQVLELLQSSDPSRALRKLLDS